MRFFFALPKQRPRPTGLLPPSRGRFYKAWGNGSTRAVVEDLNLQGFRTPAASEAEAQATAQKNVLPGTPGVFSAPPPRLPGWQCKYSKEM